MSVYVIEPNGKANTAKYVGNILSEGCVVFTSSKNNYPSGMTMDVFGSYNEVTGILKLYRYLLGWIRVLPILKKRDILHFHWLKLSVFDLCTLAVLKAKGVNLVGTVHNILPHESFPWDKFFYRRIYKLANHLIFHTKGILKEFKHYFFDPINYTIINHYFDKVQIDESKEVKTRVLFFGNIRPYKGLDLLLDAWSKLDNSVDLIVAGRPEYDISMLVERYNSIDWRLYHVPEYEVSYLFNSSGIIVLPYLKIDTSGLLFLARSYGKVIIAPKMGIFDEYILHNRNGLLFAPGDVNDLANQIEKALDTVTFNRLKQEIMKNLPVDSVGKFRNEHQKLYTKSVNG